jgi:diguanylate cyclase (GGDEF)-like protein
MAKPTDPPEKPRLLIVDDSRVMRKAISKLVDAEFEVTEAEDGEHGWQTLLADNDIQVMVADVLMPRLDGYSMICRIRAADDARLREVPIIVITGAEDEQTRERAFACGANDFITKPIDGAQLLACARVQAQLDRGGRKLAQVSEQLALQASVDPLTQLNSRRLFMELGEEHLASADQGEEKLSLIRLDLDNLKSVYAEHGDDAGDRVLVWAAEIIVAKTRDDDLLARTGGGAFAILTPSAGRLEAAILCERLRNALSAEPFQDEDLNIPVTASIGLATFGRDPGDTIEDLLALADERVAMARAAGGNRLSVSEPAEAEDGEIVIVEQPDIEVALQMIARGDSGRLEPYLLELALTVLPLIELCNRKFDLQLDFELAALRNRLSELR